MSLQVCHCGWSKVTTYHGLRTHQGRKGCTERGVKVEESEQQYMWGNVEFTNNLKDFSLEVFEYASITTDTTDYYSDKSLQVCHCGWSNVTTHHGLRTHQGMMGCMPKGMRIPKTEQCDWKNQWEEEKKHQPAKRTAVKKENAPLPPSTKVQTNSVAKTAIIKGESKSHRLLRDSPTGVQVNRSIREYPTPTYPVTAVRPKERDRNDQTLSQIADRRVMTGNRSNSRTDSETAAATIKEEPKSSFAIPQRSSQTVPGRQPQYFSTDVQVNISIREYPTPIYPVTAVRPKERDRQDRTLSQIADRRVKTGNWINSHTVSATAAATIKEEPKSPLPIPQRPSKTATRSKIGQQPQDFSTGVQSFVREHSTTTYPANVRPKEKHRKDQTLLQENRSSGERPTAPPLATAVQDKGRKDQTLSQARQERLQQKIQIREEKMSEIMSAERGYKNAPSPPSTNIHTNSAAKTVSINEECKHFPSTKPSSHTTTNSKSAQQTQDISTGVQVNRSMRERPAIPPRPTVIQPKEKDRQAQALSQVKSLVREHSSTTCPSTVVRPKEKRIEAQTLSQDVPVSPSINSATAATINEESRSSFAAAPQCFQNDFCTGVQENRSSGECPTAPPLATAVQNKEKDRKDQALSQARKERFQSELQQKIQLRQEKTSEVTTAERACESTSDSTSTNTQTNSAAAEAPIKEDPKSLCESAQPDFSTGMKVKELARMFSAATTQETAVQPKGKHTEERKPSQAVEPIVKHVVQTLSAATSQDTVVQPKEKNKEVQELPQVQHIAQTFSATTAQETVVQSKEKNKGVQEQPQNVPDSTSAATQINHAPAESTTEEVPKSSCEIAQLSDCSTGLKVKELAQMFSSTTLQETAVRPNWIHREERKLSQVKHLAQKFSATAAQEAAVQPKVKDREVQKLPQTGPDSTSAAAQMNSASPEAACETAQLTDFPHGLTVKELARMFSANPTQETAFRPKWKHREE